MAAGRAPVEFNQQSVGRLSHMDKMQQQQMALAIDRQRETQMARILNALDRMDKGKFAICAECGENIPEKRLQADRQSRSERTVIDLVANTGRSCPVVPGRTRNASCRIAATCRPRQGRAARR